jgi:CRP-like cAMP-binding protein
MSRDNDTTLKLLSTVKLFEGFGPADLNAFLNRSTHVKFKRNERIFAEGEPGRQMHVILTGKVEISRNAGSRPQNLMRLGSGESFGEMSLVMPAGVGRTANVTAAEQTATLSIDHERLAGIPDVAAKVYANIARILATRLKLATDIVVLQTQTGGSVPHSDTIGPGTTRRPSRNPTDI